ncbi:MAG: molybdopterin converting factor subunit 1 [Acidobacteriota bacterium]
MTSDPSIQSATGISVKLLLFAVLRDIVGADERDLDLPNGATADDVWQDLRRQHASLEGYATAPMTAINMQYVKSSAVLQHGDELAFIPPVSGG